MHSSYRKFAFTTAYPEILIAFLADLPFAAFEEEEGAVHAYLHTEFDVRRIEGEVRNVYHEFFDALEVTSLPDVNWNARWEASFEPISIGDFCYVRASFHPPFDQAKHEIVIDPKMSFGTGHHATTKMMIEGMSGIDLKGKSVLDMGCGTGILAILAVKMGAALVLAVDNDENCIANSRENFSLNDVAVELRKGTADVLPDRQFDVILANINRNVLLEMLGVLKSHLTEGGSLLVSGILVSDQSEFVRHAVARGLDFTVAHQRGEWCCLLFAG